MARSGYTRSVYSAVSHLLASFRNDEALRRNPLVSRHFNASDVAGSGDLVRTLIRDCIDRIVHTAHPQSASIAARQRYILLRYDIEGATRTEVCDELGITERQMYRDRRAASEAFAGLLRGMEPSAPALVAVTSSVVDHAELALHSAVRMHAHGATLLSNGRIGALARTTNDVQWRVAARCFDALQRIQREDFSEAARLIDATEETLEENSRGIGSTRAAEIRPFFDVARARIAWASGNGKAAHDLCRTGIDRFLLTRSQSRVASDPAAHVLLLAIVGSVSILTDVGDLTGADSVLGDLRRTIERMPNAEYIDLEWRCALLNFQTLVASDHGTLARDALETVARAQSLGLPIIASEAASVAAWMIARNGDLRGAKDLQEAALAFADTHDSTWARSMTHAIASLIERKIGTPARALDLSQSAVKGFAPGTAGHSYACYVLSKAQFACGMLSEALASAETVLRSEAPREHMRGAAYLIMAESAAMLGERKRATECIEGALDVLGRLGNGYLLQEARALRDRVA